jgi:hypothetical protein
MYDGTPVSSPGQLANALLKRPVPIARAFAENLMTYALGRRMADEDQTTIRAITRTAGANGYRFSSFVTGVVNSPAFRMRRAEPAAATAATAAAADDAR